MIHVNDSDLQKITDEYKDDTLYSTWCIDSFWFEMLSEATLNVGTHEKIDYKDECKMFDEEKGYLEFKNIAADKMCHTYYPKGKFDAFLVPHEETITIAKGLEVKENDKVIIYYKNNIIESKTKLIGEHNLSNLACALSIAFLLNVDCDDIKKILPTINNVEHRLNLLTMNNWILLDDSYNSNHIGFINALKTLNEFKMKKVLITPGIIEQNKESIEEEISLSTLINNIVDIVILIKKPKIKQYINHYIEFNSFNEAIKYLKMNYINEQLAILIENDLPEIYLRWNVWITFYWYMVVILSNTK